MSGSTSEAEPGDWRRLLTPWERARMLGDIARVSLAAGARLFPDQPWQDLDVTAGSLAARKSPIERLGFIEHVLPLLRQAVTQIERDPISNAVSQSRPAAPAARARRVTTQALLQAVRRGPTLRSLEETVTVVSSDTPENRAVKSFLRVLEQDSAAIARIAEAEEEPEAAERAERCRRQLRGLLAGSLWENIVTDRRAWNKPPTLRAVWRPEYGRVFRETARYRAGFGFDWNQPQMTLPQRETWRLYETWCLFATLDLLGALGFVPVAGGGSDTQDLFSVREGRLTFALATGSASCITLRSHDGRRLALIYNQTFAEGRTSLSHTMQPDITLASDTGLWILDAKFKSYSQSGEEGEDINQMHAYRDAIVDEAARRVVVRAWCLYAGQADAPNRPYITFGRSEVAPVGALCLRPGGEATLTHLRLLLSRWLGVEPTKPAQPAFPQT